jgi:hypothetical protein
MKNKKTKGILNVMIFIVMLFMITQFVFAEEITEEIEGKSFFESIIKFIKSFFGIYFIEEIGTVLNITNDTIQDGNSGMSGMPPILIFGCALVNVTIMDLEKDEQFSMAVSTVLVNKILDYTTSNTSYGILLEERDIINLYISSEEEIQKFKGKKTLNIPIRCQDGRISSLSPFTKEDCFWTHDFDDIHSYYCITPYTMPKQRKCSDMDIDLYLKLLTNGTPPELEPCGFREY